MVRALLTLVIVTFPARAQTRAEAFERGLAFYQKQDFAGARDAFEAAIKVGPSTARLLHDLALAYYRLDDKPRALGAWRQALALDPNFGPARAGRALLENQQRMRAFEGEGARHLVRGVLERASPYVLSWLLAALLTLSAWVGLRRAHARRAARAEDRDRPAIGVGVIAAAAATLLVGAALLARVILIDDAFATVVASPVAARSLPSPTAVTLFEPAPGGEVLVRRAQDGWAQIETPDGSVGWVESTALAGGPGDD